MTGALRLPAKSVEEIVRAAAETPSVEICGLLVDAGQGLTAHLTPNRHPEPERGFAICDAAHARIQREARARGGRIVGCFHSHPSGDTAPSEMDLLAAHEDGFIWLICAPDGRLQAWRARMRGGVKSFVPLSLELHPIAENASAH